MCVLSVISVLMISVLFEYISFLCLTHLVAALALRMIVPPIACLAGVLQALSGSGSGHHSKITVHNMTFLGWLGIGYFVTVK